MPRLHIDGGFERAIRRLPANVQRRARTALDKFIDNPRRPGLNFEKLQGRENYFSIRVSQNYRILLRREHDESGELFAVVDVGTHRIYRAR